MFPELGKKLIRFLLPPVFWLGVWQVGAGFVGSDLLLPAPLSVAAALWKLAGAPAFWLAALSTLGRIFGGLLAGCVLGGALAGLTYRSRWARLLLAPAIKVVRATPVVCFILLVYLWVARARIPGAIAALMVMPVMWGSLDAGLHAVDGQLLEMARAYRFSAWKTVRLVYLPSLRTHFLSGFLTSLGLAWKSGVAAEVICPPRLAIGSEISRAKTALETPQLFAWTLVIIALSLSMERLLRRLVGKGAAG